MRRFKILMAIIVLVLGTLVFLPKDSVAYAENIDTIDATWLLKTDVDTDGTESVPYESNITVGKSWGYGKFMLGQERVTLGTEAKDGYQLVGWQITYNDQDDRIVYISKDIVSNDNTIRVENADGGLVIERIDGLVTYTLTFTDVAKDGYYEAGSFTISNIAENLTVSAVYDHIYYSVDVTDFAQIVDTESMIKTTCGSQLILNKEGLVDGVYADAYLVEDDKIYYVGDVYAGSEYFYTVHKTISDTPIDEQIDISRGAFRLEDQISAEIDVDFDADNIETDSINIVVNSVSLDGKELEEVIITAHDDYKNTIKVSADFAITRAEGECEIDTCVLTVDYTNLYLVGLNAKIDGVDIDNTHEDYNLIMNAMTVHNALLNSNISNDLYFVKENSEIRVNAGQTITQTIDGGKYSYYNFKAIDGKNSNEKTYSPMTESIEIIVEYSSIEYLIDFKFAFYSNGTCNELSGEFNLEDSFTMKRGDEVRTITRTLIEDSDTEYVSDNVGYKFYGFAYDKFNIIQNDSIDVVIDEEKPKGYTILMVYTEIDYSIDFIGFDRITLNDNSKTIYPINSATLNFGGNTYTIADSELRNANIKSYNNGEIDQELKVLTISNNGVNIHDFITFTLNVNVGFKINGFKFNLDDIEYISNNNVVSFQLTKQLISSIKDTKITLIVEEDYSFYNVEYYIDPAMDSNFADKIIMADIDVDITDLPHAIKTYEYAYNPYIYTEEDWNTNYGNYYVRSIVDNEYVYTLNTSNVYNDSDNDYYVATVSKVLLSGLHLYDKVALISTPKSIIDSNRELNYSYIFIRYTEDNMTDLSYIYYEPEDSFAYYSHQTSILKNIKIKVSYSIPNTQLRLSISNGHDGAYSFNNLIVLGDGEIVNITTDGQDKFYIIDTSAHVVVKLRNEAQEVIAFGYKFIGYTMIVDNVAKLTKIEDMVDPYTYEFDITSTGLHYLILEFELIEYRIEVVQSGAGLTDVKVEFDNANNYKIATVDGVEIGFNIPTGYYVGEVSYLDGVNYIEQKNLAQTNEYLGNTFCVSYMNTIENNNSLSNMLRTYARLIETTEESYYLMTIKVDYYIHTYDITINFALTGAEYNDYWSEIITPSFAINYTFDGAPKYQEGILRGRTITFSSIEYGVKFKIILLSEIKEGLEYDGWAFDNNTINGGSLGNEYNYSYNLLEINSDSDLVLTQNLGFNYRWRFKSYTIKVQVSDGDNDPTNDDSKGSPKIRIKNKSYSDDLATVTNVVLYDNIEVKSNGNKGNGYVFNKFYYYIDKYVEYTYHADDWTLNYANYYIYNNGNYVKNNNATYYDEKQYFKLQQDYKVEITEQSSMTFVFEIDNFKADTYGLITIYVEYKEFEVTINTDAILENGNDIVIIPNSENGTISPKQIASYTIIAKDTETGIERLLTDGKTANRKDRIFITMTFNNIEIIEGEGNNAYTWEYNLSNGVDNSGISFSVEGDGIGYSYDDNRANTIYFDIGVFLSSIDDNNPQLTITYKYIAKTVNITSTTNIEHQDFYGGGNYFYTDYNADPYGFAATDGNSYKQSLGVNFKVTTQFLGKAKFSYSKRGSTGKFSYKEYEDFFYIPSVNIYSGNTKASLIDPNEYANYGIKVYYTTAEFEGQTVSIIDYIDVRMVSNLYIEYQVNAMLYFNADKVENGAYIFEREYQCKDDAVGVGQTLKIGTSSDNDIRAAQIIYASMSNAIKYELATLDSDGNVIGTTELTTERPTDAGRYVVLLAFDNNSTYSWLKDIKLNYLIYLDIIPKEIILNHMNVATKYEKVYDGGSTFNHNSLIDLLIITDEANSFRVDLSKKIITIKDSYNIEITETTDDGSQTSAFNASDIVYYNLNWTNIELANENRNNKNFKFKLTADTNEKYSYVMEGVIKISKRELKILGLDESIRDKVYDGNDTLYLKEDAELSLDNTADPNEVELRLANIKMKYVDELVGINKPVTIDASNAITGSGASNYYIDKVVTKSTIYPYSVKTYIDGIGEIVLENRRGRDEGIGVDAIPVGASLKVSVIYRDTTEYAGIYDAIKDYVDSNNIFAIGYGLSIMDNGVNREVSKDLHLIVPKVDRMLSAIWNTGDTTGELTYTEEDSNIVIALNQIELDVDNIILTQQRVLFKLWQIILIVVLVVVLLTAIIIIAIVLKKRKDAKYSVHDKI